MTTQELEKLDTNNLNPIGCFRLVSAVLQHALLQEPVAIKIGNKKVSSQSASIKIARELEIFADSPIITHWADVTGYDKDRVRKAILMRALKLKISAGIL